MTAVEIRNVNKSFGEHQALTNVSIQVPQNSIFGLLGPNGAGKTTLIRIINQITAPDTGEVLLHGESLKPEHVHDIGYLPEERGLYKKMKVGEQCMYLAQLKGMEKKEAKEKLKFWFDKFEISGWWNKKIEELSKGMAQKIQFVTTVIHEPKLLILDEPFSGFDPINVELILSEIEKLREDGATIILSTHNMESAEAMCDNIALIDHSKVILQGEIGQLKNDFKESLYEISFSGNLMKFTHSLWTDFELVEKVSTSERDHLVKIKLHRGKNLNNLLETVLSEVEIKEVKEVIPSMREIFIKAIENNSKEEVTNE